MIAHTSLGVSNYRKAKEFYTKVLAPLGYSNNMEYGEAAGFNDGKNTDFWIAKQDTVVSTHVAFEARTKDEVEAFYTVQIVDQKRIYSTRLVGILVAECIDACTSLLMVVVVLA